MLHYKLNYTILMYLLMSVFIVILQGCQKEPASKGPVNITEHNSVAQHKVIVDDSDFEEPATPTKRTERLEISLIPESQQMAAWERPEPEKKVVPKERKPRKKVRKPVKEEPDGIIDEFDDCGNDPMCGA